MMFLHEVARQTNIKVTLITSRIEKLTDCDFDTVCARGFSELSELLYYTEKHSKLRYGVFLKGAKVHDEIKTAQKKFDFQYNLYPSETNKAGKIITVNEVCYKDV
jgi:16S rRNA G527 N7-methylase RsmG